MNIRTIFMSISLISPVMLVGMLPEDDTTATTITLRAALEEKHPYIVADADKRRKWQDEWLNLRKGQIAQALGVTSDTINLLPFGQDPSDYSSCYILGNHPSYPFVAKFNKETLDPQFGAKNKADTCRNGVLCLTSYSNLQATQLIGFLQSYVHIMLHNTSVHLDKPCLVSDDGNETSYQMLIMPTLSSPFTDESY